MGKEHSWQKANVIINDKDDYEAFSWDLSVGLDKALIKISCLKTDDARILSLEKQPNPIVKLIDFFGIELRYATKFLKIETLEEVGAVTQIDYYFEVELKVLNETRS